MKQTWLICTTAALFLFNAGVPGQPGGAQNPVIFADVPDISVIRVDNTYYMSSTTMHMSPGVPVMKSDGFMRKKGDPQLPLVWQWNRNPGNTLWSATQRIGFLRLKTGRIDSLFIQAGNILTQRTIGHECYGLFNYSTKNPGRFVDFDWFHISNNNTGSN